MDNSFVFVDANPNMLNNVTKMELEPRPPEMKSMHVVSSIRNRYARTVVTSKYINEDLLHAQEATFSIVLPDTAFVAGFVMEIKGKKYEAYVKEKEEAKQEYDLAVSSGRAAAHVAVSARDSNKFTVSANVEPHSDVTFILTYEELLVRKHSKYDIVINLHPTQFIDDLQVDVHINETRPVRNVETPAFRSGSEITTSTTKNKFASIKKENDKTIHVSFHPTVEEQKEMTNNASNDGISGQFVVQYDVERDPLGGEVLVNDGYFVHFFSPSELKPIPKLVVFVLDVSGSMHGRKIEQLKEAMKSILTELNPEDNFNIVKFSNYVQILYSNTAMQENANTSLPATKENIEKAQKVIETMCADGGTNICDALITALSLTLKRVPVSENQEKKHKQQPMIVFLTDGQANVGESRPKNIIEIVAKRNDTENKAAIFTLAFGDDANKEFLKELAMKNSGFLRNIYEASDASLQLQDFYKQISSPLLTNVNFKYSEDVSETTKHKFDILFNGSEFVVTGKVDKVIDGFVVVEGSSLYGIDDFSPTIIPICPTEEEKEKFGSLERLWAYMTIKQLLDKKYEKKITDKGIVTETPEKQALKLALKYSFVTPVTSLVVVKPETKDENDLQWGSVHVASHMPSMRRNILRGGGGPASGMQKQSMSYGFGQRALCPPPPQQLSSMTFGSSPTAFCQSPSQSMAFGSSPSAFCPSPPQPMASGYSPTGNIRGFLREKRIPRRVTESSQTDTNSSSGLFGSSASPKGASGGDFNFHNRVDSTIHTNSLKNKITEPLSLVLPKPPKLASMQIITNVQNLQSHSVVRTKFINQDSRALQSTFTVVLPDSAFITGFAMEADGVKYEGHKQEPQSTKEYNEASAQNLAAGYVTNKTGNLQTFIVTVNVEGQSEATFILTYEERLTKKNNNYELITNLIPRLLIDNLEIDIKINGSKPITIVDRPLFKSQAGITVCKSIVVIKKGDDSAQVYSKPTTAQQDETSRILREEENNDVSRQLVVEFITEADLNVVNDPASSQAEVDYIVVKSAKFTA